MDGDSQLVFNSGGHSSCANVTIISDGLFEGEEMHCLNLQSSESDIVIGTISLTCILIADADSKFKQN